VKKGCERRQSTKHHEELFAPNWVHVSRKDVLSSLVFIWRTSLCVVLKIPPPFWLDRDSVFAQYLQESQGATVVTVTKLMTLLIGKFGTFNSIKRIL